MKIEHGPTVLHLRDEGDGEPVLLLHGFTDSHATFWESGWADALDGCRLLAFDARGHGSSTKPTSADAYAEEHRVADALRVLDRAGVTRAHVVGYSMGGWTASLLASTAPERVCSLAVGGIHGEGQSLAGLRRLIGAGVPAFVSLIESVRALTPGARARMLANDPAALAAVVARDRAPLSNDVVERIAAPTLAWVGQRDPLAPLVERFVQRLPRGELVVAPDVEHFGAFDHPAAQRAVRRHIDRYRDTMRVASSSTSASSSRNV